MPEGGLKCEYVHATLHSVWHGCASAGVGEHENVHPGVHLKSNEVQEVVGIQVPGQKMGGLIAATSDSTTTF